MGGAADSAGSSSLSGLISDSTATATSDKSVQSSDSTDNTGGGQFDVLLSLINNTSPGAIEVPIDEPVTSGSDGAALCHDKDKAKCTGAF